MEMEAAVPFTEEKRWWAGYEKEYIMPLRQKPGLIVVTDKKTLALCDITKQVLLNDVIMKLEDEEESSTVEALCEASNNRFLTGHQDGTLCLWQLEVIPL